MTSTLVQQDLKAKFHSSLGPPILAALEESWVNEIMANDTGELWLQSQGQPMVFSGARLTEAEREVIIAQVATFLGRVVDWDHAIIEGELPFSHHRFEGFLPPVSLAPAFIIRKHLAEPLPLTDYVTKEILAPWQAEFLRQSVARGEMLILSGAPKSGKTTLLAAILATLTEQAAAGWVRTLILEDTREIACTLSNTLRLCSRPPYSLNDLVRASLRSNPTRLIVGEVRGAEALEMLKALNVGISGGLSTLHANGVDDIFDRLALMVQEAGLLLPRGVFASAVNVLAHLDYSLGVRRLTEIARVVPQGQDFILVPITEEDCHA